MDSAAAVAIETEGATQEELGAAAEAYVFQLLLLPCIKPQLDLHLPKQSARAVWRTVSVAVAVSVEVAVAVEIKVVKSVRSSTMVDVTVFKTVLVYG